MQQSHFRKMNFLGIKIDVLRRTEVVNKIVEFALTDKTKFITYLHAHCVNIASSDYAYRSILNNSDGVYADGQGVVWASRFLGIPLPERVNVMDFFDSLAPRLRDEKITIYLLGGTLEVVKKAAEALKKRELKIIGSRSGFFDKTGEEEIIREINRLRPNILMLGMGVPKQEKWFHDHRSELDVNLCWAVGGAFKLLSGRLRRAPGWMINGGLEWLYVGLQDFNRLCTRYLLGNPLFIYRVLKYKLKCAIHKIC